MGKALAEEHFLVARLTLDDENPRLPEELQGATQGALLQYMEKMYDLEEIGHSMADRGYFEEEPLLTVESRDDPNLRVVVEGNRRLATLKLLTEVESRRALGSPRIWEELAAKVATAGHRLTEVPVRLYATKRELLEYLGFRHVSGLMQWTAEAKARYVYSLVVNYGYSFYAAGRAIGSRQDAIRRQFIAYSALLHGRSEGITVEPAIRRFGVYYRALQNPGIRAFLHLKGWADGTPEDVHPLGDPPRLEELIDWVFVSRVVRESRQLDQLGRAVSDASSLAMLRETRDLDAALDELPGDRDSVVAALRLSYRNLAKAYSEVHEFAGDEAVGEEISRISRLLARVRDASSIANEG